MASTKKPKKAEATSGDVAPAYPASMWEHGIDRAHQGDLQALLHMLLVPPTEPGPLAALPDDPRLRERVLWAFMKSPASRNAEAMLDAWTKVYAGTRGALSPFELNAASLVLKHMGPGAVRDLAESLGMKSGEHLVKAARKVRKKPKA